MSTNEQREQWAAHIAEEGRALELQQRAAGGTHSPTERPLPHSVDELESAVAAAVAAERQRCAEIADSWGVESKVVETFADFTQWELRACAAMARAVAAEIRNRAAPPIGR